MDATFSPVSMMKDIRQRRAKSDIMADICLNNFPVSRNSTKEYLTVQICVTDHALRIYIQKGY
jgi:hypothetical protein